MKINVHNAAKKPGSIFQMSTKTGHKQAGFYGALSFSSLSSLASAIAIGTAPLPPCIRETGVFIF